jgi:hypothetical protein
MNGGPGGLQVASANTSNLGLKRKQIHKNSQTKDGNLTTHH